MYKYDDDTYMDEQDIRDIGFSKIAGVDEVGRGPLFGPVTIACVMLHVDHGIVGLRDSKKLSDKRREEFAEKIKEKALAISITEATNKEIDRINILGATIKCMHKAVSNLHVVPEFVFVDGNRVLYDLVIPNVSVPGADGAQIYEINDKGRKIQIGHHYENVAAASIIAKVHRDKAMMMYDKMYPEYGFCRNKGYPTQEHREAIRKYGITPLHRKSYKGVG
jgi:ribonuclease HII